MKFKQFERFVIKRGEFHEKFVLLINIILINITRFYAYVEN